MLDLVKPETERIDSRFLEPACGEGAFLTEILRRKLAVVDRQYGKSLDDYARYAVMAVASIYGVDIMEDNAEICRRNLFEIWNAAYTAKAKAHADDQCRKTVKYILRKNIVCGNTLTMLKNDGTPIEFAEWNLVTGDQVKRRDFTLNALLNNDQTLAEPDLLNWQDGEKKQVSIPSPIREHPLTDYRRLAPYE